MTNEEILRSWKEIADYLKCDKKTCSRWEEDCGLPVCRVDSRSSRSRVFAFKSELDQWLAQKAYNRSHSTATRTKRKVPLFAIAIAALAVGAPAFWFVGRKHLSSEASAPVIMVLPIRYQDASAYDRYLAEGLTRELIQRLVISTRARVTTVPWPLEKEAPVAARSEPLGLVTADYAIEGEVRKKEDNLSLSVLLNDRRKKRLLWQKDFEATTGGLAPLLDQICGEVRKHLLLKNELDPLSGSVPNLDAFDASMKGRYLLDRIGDENKDPWTLYHKGAYYNRLGDRETNELAIQLFSQARELDPKFAAAYLGLAECYTNYVNFNWRFEQQWLDKAEKLIEQAQQLTPNLPPFFTLRMRILLLREIYFGVDNSRAYFELAKEGLDRYPYDGRVNSIVGYCYFRRYDREGQESDLEEALKYKERAYYADQFTIDNIVYAELLMLKGEYGKALEICAAIEKIHPSSLVKYLRAEIYYYQGRLEESEEIFLNAVKPVNARVAALHFLGRIAARRNDRAAALKIIDELEALGPNKDFNDSEQLAMASIYAGLKEIEKAQSLLRKIFSEDQALTGRHLFRRYLEIDPNFLKIRPQFALPKSIRSIE